MVDPVKILLSFILITMQHLVAVCIVSLGVCIEGPKNLKALGPRPLI